MGGMPFFSLTLLRIERRTLNPLGMCSMAEPHLWPLFYWNEVSLHGKGWSETHSLTHPPTHQGWFPTWHSPSSACFIFMYVWVVCLCVYLCITHSHNRPEKDIGTWNWNYRQLWAIMWVLRYEPKSSRREATVLNIYTISLAPFINFSSYHNSFGVNNF